MIFEKEDIVEFNSLFDKKLTKKGCHTISFYDGKDEAQFEIKKEEENVFYIMRATNKKHYDCIFDFNKQSIKQIHTWNLDLPNRMIKSTFKMALDRLKKLEN